MRRLLTLALVALPLLIVQAQSRKPGDILTEYDRFKDETTVRIRPITVWGEAVPALSMSLVAAYRGRTPTKLDSVDLQLISLDHAPRFDKGDTTLYLIIDGERVSAGAFERNTAPPLVGAYVDSLSFHLPLSFVSRIVSAKTVEVRLADTEFQFNPTAQKAMRRFLDIISPQSTIPGTR